MRGLVAGERVRARRGPAAASRCPGSSARSPAARPRPAAGRTPRSPRRPARPRTPAAPGEDGAGEEQDERDEAVAQRVQVLRPGDLEVVGAGQRQVDLGRPGEALHHRGAVHPGNGRRVSRHRLRSPNRPSSSASSASPYGRRCGSIRTWQRSAMAWIVAPVVSSIRSRAVSCGATAYGSATMSSTVKLELVMDGRPDRSGARAGLRAPPRRRTRPWPAAPRVPPSKPRHSSRSRPTSS